MISDQRGAVKPMLCIIVLIIIVYVGYKFSIPYYHYYSLKSECRAIARLVYDDSERYKELVVSKVRSLNAPVEGSNINVTIHQNKRVRIIASWREVVDLAGLYKLPLHFEIDIEE